MEFGQEDSNNSKGKEGSRRAIGGRRGQRSHLATRGLTSGSGERIAKVVEAFTEMYSNSIQVESSGLEIGLKTMPKTIYGDDYDVVVVHATGDIETTEGNVVALTMVVPVVLEDNSNILTPRKVVQEMDIFFDKTRGQYITAGRNNNQSEFYLPTEVLEENLAANIEIALNTSKDAKVVRLDGIMIPSFADLDKEEIVQEYGGRGVDPILDYWYKLTHDTVMSVTEMCKDSKIKTNFFTHTKGNVDKLGVHIDDTFTLQVYTMQNTEKGSFGPNTRGVSEALLSINGVVSLTPGIVDVEVNGRPKEVQKLIPNVIARNVDTQYILEDALLSVAALSTITNDNRWMDILLETTSETRDPGLTIQSIGLEARPFNKKNVTRQAKEQILFDNCIEGVMVSLDIPEYSLMSGAFAVIQAAASGSKEALKEIVITAAKMCADEKGNSSFDPEFPLDNILESMELPNGYLTNGADGTKHTLSSIDVDYICATHPKLIDTYVEAETNPDGMLDLIAIYNDINLDKARLTGIRRRVTFTTDFINELTEAFADCGFSLTMDPTQTYKKSSGRGFDRKRTSRFAGTVDSNMINYKGGENRSRRGRGGRSTFIKRRY